MKGAVFGAAREGIYVYLRGLYELYTRWLDNDAVEKQMIRVGRAAASQATHERKSGCCVDRRRCRSR